MSSLKAKVKFFKAEILHLKAYDDDDDDNNNNNNNNVQ